MNLIILIYPIKPKMAYNQISIPTTLTTVHGANQISFLFWQLGHANFVQLSRAKRSFRLHPNWVSQNKGCSTSQVSIFPLKSSPMEFSSMFSCRAVGSNISEDTDDMFDDLVNKYGKVVFKRTDQKPPSAEIDDDTESLSFAVAMAKVANEVKAADIKVLFVKPLVYWTRFFIIATAFSRPQIGAIRTKMADLAEKKFGKVPNGDSKPNSWTLLDFGDVVVHLFLPQQREFYNLEEFYGNATPIELLFEDDKPFRR